jgi:hypothetical protein
MQCILYKIYFWKVFHMYYKLICVLYALLYGQNFILVKCGCYTLWCRCERLQRAYVVLIRFPLCRACILIWISTTLSDMSDDLFIAPTHSNATNIR